MKFENKARNTPEHARVSATAGSWLRQRKGAQETGGLNLLIFLCRDVDLVAWGVAKLEMEAVSTYKSESHFKI